MINYDMRELQLHILKTLVAFDDVCRRHNVPYYIIFGTLLGAVRHKGFIPWDDDIDVGVPRPEYERLVSHWREWLPEPYEFVCHETDPRYLFDFGKVQDASTTVVERKHIKYVGGVYIDVFPLDGMSSNGLCRWMEWTRMGYYKRITYYLLRDPYKRGHGPSSWIPLLARRLYSPGALMRGVNKLMTSHGYEESDYVSALHSGPRNVIPKAAWGTPVPYEFEGHTVMGPADAHAYLLGEYGSDYMTPPEPRKRKSHLFHYVDLKKPYREYDAAGLFD